jgi:magnesium-transporting ATPase (P-type)
MKIQNLLPEAALRSLHSHPEGLHSAEAEKRLAEYGINSIERRKKENPILIFSRELSNLLAIVLWITAVVVFSIAFIYAQKDMYPLGFAIIGVVLINAFFSFWQSLKAERAMEALQNILPVKSLVIRSGNWLSIAAETLVPGDIISLREGDTAAADIRLLESHSLRVDTSHITGESLPSFRHSEPDKSDDIFQARNIVLAVVRVVSGRAQGVVFATGTRSEFGKMAGLTLASEKKPSPLQHEIALVSKRVALFSIALGVGFALIGVISGLPFNQALLLGAAMIVANIPEGLMPTITLSLAFAAQRMSKRNALVRHLPAVEALGSTTVICTDKTGTLTLNQLKVKEVDWLAQNFDAGQFIAKKDFTAGESALLRAMHWAHSLMQSSSPQKAVTKKPPGDSPRDAPGDTLSMSLGDPLEVALVTFANQCTFHKTELEIKIETELELVSEIPFDDTRRRQSVIVVDRGGQVLLLSKGAPEVMLARSSRRVNAQGTAEPLSTGDRDALLQRAESYARRGLKVLGYAQRRLPQGDYAKNSTAEDIEVELEFLGLVALEDPIRPEVPAAIAACHSAGIRVMMITGDHPETARSVAEEIGIFPGASANSDPHSNPNSNAEVILGHELEHLSATQLQLALEKNHIAFARVRANQKQRIVQALKDKKHVVAVTGDGVNDAPALRCADVGVAMGICGTDVARESSDVILLDDNFATIVSAIREGRGIYANIRNFMTYIFSSNVPEAVPFVLFMLFPIPLPLTILQILSIDLGTDLVPALGLGADPAGEKLMHEPPRGYGRHLIDRSFILKAYLWFGLWLALASMGGYFYVLLDGGWTWGQPVEPNSLLARQAATATLVSVILMQIANVFLCRQQPFSVGNNLIFLGVALEMVFIAAVMFFAPLQSILNTAQVTWTLFPVVFCFMGLMILGEKLRRKVISKKLKPSPDSLAPRLGD